MEASYTQTIKLPDKWWHWPMLFKLASVVIALGSVSIAMCIFFAICQFVIDYFHLTLLRTLWTLEIWMCVGANLAVAYFAFPYFRRSRKRGLGYLGFASLLFLYGALFSYFLSTGPSSPAARWSPLGQELYFGSRHVIYMVGLFFYARGVYLLTRVAGR